MNAASYYARGWWRRETFVDDLRAAAADTPGRTVFVNWRRNLNREVVVTFGDLAAAVDRLSAGLRGLGLRPGDVVAFQLPNWWEAAALALACLDAGLIAVPMMATLGAREVERILSGTEAGACVVVDRWETARPARLLADLHPRLPRLRHRIVIGDAAATGATAFTDLLQAPAPDASAPRGPDEVSLILFTSGTTGEVKGILHTPNTQYASTRPRRGALRGVPMPRTATPADLTHSVGMRTNVLTPLVTGCCSVFADTRDPDVWLDLLARHRVTHFLGAPHMLLSLIRAQRRRYRPLPALRVVTSTGAPLPASLVAPIHEWLSPGLVNGFGMTETGGLTATAVDDPPGWAGHSIGRPVPGCEIRLVADGPPSPDRAFRLHVRGPSVCAGTFRLRDRRPTWDPAATDGWYDTGDLVREDGRGGLCYLSRVADRIGSPHPIPILEVEDELLRHPAVADVALVGCPDRNAAEETVCAVVVPAGPAPTLTDLREHLLRTGMTEWWLPTRLECVDALPRNELGKVRKTELRARLHPPE
ncbi:AMP-binding protein [Actinoallomurus rhizosphaericola]|uniref:AMP-binding protein n=1 Tax=Actinoallomurus rhizosphaericola TaxID=2952536 RepID=UPI0020939B6C|nr:AMP-binding protein [Actinoallomurus rhizosphaericola]MCO5998582.1 AMP-binding protein [Actinoallomurus rhizosphaericola]